MYKEDRTTDVFDALFSIERNDDQRPLDRWAQQIWDESRLLWALWPRTTCVEGASPTRCRTP